MIGQTVLGAECQPKDNEFDPFINGKLSVMPVLARG